MWREVAVFADPAPGDRVYVADRTSLTRLRPASAPADGAATARLPPPHPQKKKPTGGPRNPRLVPSRRRRAARQPGALTPLLYAVAGVASATRARGGGFGGEASPKRPRGPHVAHARAAGHRSDSSAPPRRRRRARAAPTPLRRPAHAGPWWLDLTRRRWIPDALTYGGGAAIVASARGGPARAGAAAVDARPISVRRLSVGAAARGLGVARIVVGRRFPARPRRDAPAPERPFSPLRERPRAGRSARWTSTRRSGDPACAPPPLSPSDRRGPRPRVRELCATQPAETCFAVAERALPSTDDATPFPWFAPPVQSPLFSAPSRPRVAHVSAQAARRGVCTFAYCGKPVPGRAAFQQPIYDAAWPSGTRAPACRAAHGTFSCSIPARRLGPPPRWSTQPSQSRLLRVATVSSPSGLTLVRAAG